MTANTAVTPQFAFNPIYSHGRTTSLANICPAIIALCLRSPSASLAYPIYVGMPIHTISPTNFRNQTKHHAVHTDAANNANQSNSSLI